MVDRERLNRMRSVFEEQFGSTDGLVLSRAPGRVNLIGEHTDYNGGYVLPMAIAFDVAVLGRATGGDKVRLHSVDFDGSASFVADDLAFDRERQWVNYPKGVMKFLGEAGVHVPAVDAVISGTVPIGGGLSSSAAFEVAVATFLLELAGSSMDGVDLARLARRAENEFVGVQCGIMDQFVSVFAEKGKALFIDCKTLEHRAMPLFGEDCEFIITNSMVRHSLGETEYHTRQAECREGLSTLTTVLGERETLRDVDERDYRGSRHIMPPIVRRRLDHVFSENRRVLDAVEAMKTGDATTFGTLMNASHDSLRDDYEVSCAELDLLVDAARAVEGVLGSRMTGGGFGGCTVSLVRKDAAERFIEAVGAGYETKTGIHAEFIRTDAAQGATTVRL